MKSERKKLPEWMNPKKFLDVKVQKLKAPYSARMFCGKCGLSIYPEDFSNNHCRKKHNLDFAGIYEVRYKIVKGQKKFYEGWWKRSQ